MTRRLVLLGLLAVSGGLFAANLRAAPVPMFFTPLEDEANSITALGGTTPNDNATFAPGFSGNAYQSTNSGTNNGGWARWDTNAVATIFGLWNDANGITVDQYFRGVGGSTLSEGLWSMVRRNNVGGSDPGDQYFITSHQNGKLRLLFANSSASQYKFTFNGGAAVPASQEYANNVDIALTDATTYHLTVSLGNGAFKVYLDDIGGSQYSNATPIYEASQDINTGIVPSGFNWTLPVGTAVGSSGSMQGRQTREMDIGIRGFGNTGNTINNFGGTLRSGHWVDEVKVYNGVYTPADLIAPPSVDGDYNGNGFVDSADYVLWRKGVQPLPSGEVDNIGTTDAQDYVEWQARFGNPTPGGGGGGLGGGVIPEPATSVFALMSLCLTFVLRRSRR